MYTQYPLGIDTKCWPAERIVMKKEQFGELILASEDTLYHVAKTLLHNDADCADAIQESIVKAFANLHTLRQDSYAKTWLIRILINECYALIRKEKRVISLEEFQGKEAVGVQEDYSDLYEAICKLPQNIRICVTLYYLEGYSVRETAQMLKVTESTVKNRLARARKKLRNILDEECTAIRRMECR